MSERREQRSHSKSIPLRVRFRTPTEQLQWEREQGVPTGKNGTPDVPPQSQRATPISTAANAAELTRRTHQIKELVRLGNLLRADLRLEDVLQQIAASIAACTGFRLLVINLLNEQEKLFAPVAFTGASKEAEFFIRENPVTLDQLRLLMRPEFRMSQSYFIPHEHHHLFSDIAGYADKTADEYQEGGWHPEDELLVPFYSPRENKMLGFLSLDDPEDGQKPTLESIEVVELFANQAAIAIDNVRIFQEREAERVALERGVAQLHEDLLKVQRRELRNVRPTHVRLQPIVVTVNAMIEGVRSIIGDVQQVTQAVEDHTHKVHTTSELLVHDTAQQERQVHQISTVISNNVTMMHQVAERAEDLSRMAVEAMDVTLKAQEAVDRAVDGMGKVREAATQSARTMKRLGESGQEINQTIIEMNDLTTRMHLLSLNAAIEAARASEHGQGFAVIAQEIRMLATHSAEATHQVGNYIRGFQHETAAVSQSIEQSTQQVVMQTELVTQTGIALDAISVVTDQMANTIQGICTTAENQSHGSQVVVNAVGEIRRMTGEITHHMQEMQGSLEHLVELTNALQSRMAVFNMPGK